MVASDSVIEKIQSRSHIVDIIMGYLDVNVYVKMPQLNKKLYESMKDRFGAHALFIEYHTFLNQHPSTGNDVMKFRQYAICPGIQSFSYHVHVDVHQFTLPVPENISVIKNPSKAQSMMNLRYNMFNGSRIEPFECCKEFYSWNELIDKKVPAMIAFKKNGEHRMEYLIQLDKWECRQIYFTQTCGSRGVEKTIITFSPKIQTKNSPHEQWGVLQFEYEKNKRFPSAVLGNVECNNKKYSVQFRRDYILIEKGCYQEAHFEDGVVMLFYRPFQYKPNNDIFTQSNGDEEYCVIM